MAEHNLLKHALANRTAFENFKIKDKREVEN